jgi:hypothetical protein
MDTISENWFFILVAVAFALMHLFGHGHHGHGGHKHGPHSGEDKQGGGSAGAHH